MRVANIIDEDFFRDPLDIGCRDGRYPRQQRLEPGQIVVGQPLGQIVGHIVDAFPIKHSPGDDARPHAIQFVGGHRLIRQPLEMVGYHERMDVVAGLDNPWTRRRKVRLSELVTEPWLMPESDNIAMALISEAFRSAGLEVPTPHVISNSMTFRIRLIETGRFIGILPESTLKFAGRRLHAKILPVALSMLSPPTVAISLKNRTPNPISKLFADEIRAAVKERRTFLDRAPP